MIPFFLIFRGKDGPSDLVAVYDRFNYCKPCCLVD